MRYVITHSIFLLWQTYRYKASHWALLLLSSCYLLKNIFSKEYPLKETNFPPESVIFTDIFIDKQIFRKCHACSPTLAIQLQIQMCVCILYIMCVDVCVCRFSFLYKEVSENLLKMSNNTDLFFKSCSSLSILFKIVFV